jgi:ubiquinone/menaquinone biosynthesis C-methylase UbiE
LERTHGRKDRLGHGTGTLEQVRTQDILGRFLPKQGTIIDVGGAAGVYALWLARLGYQVHLVDLMPLHVQQAQQASAEQLDFPLAGVHLGDACKLGFADNSADVVLLFGPLYHLTERADRIQALREAYRVLKPGGLVFTATISHFASLMDSFKNNFIQDAPFVDIVKHALLTGQHRNTTGDPRHFTTAYFHTVDEIESEVKDANFNLKTSLAVESVGYMDSNFASKWNDPVQRERILELLRLIEAEPTFIGASSHLITIGSKPD